MVWVKNFGVLSSKLNINVFLSALIYDYVNRWYRNKYILSSFWNLTIKNKQARVCLSTNQTMLVKLHYYIL